MRVLLDTNILISYLLTARPDSPVAALMQVILAGELTLLLPEQLVAEFADKVATKPYLAARISPEQATAFIADLAAIGELVPRLEGPFLAVTRDPKDDYLLAYALVGQADYLISRDKDLLDLPPIEGLSILSPGSFARLLSVR